ncbi:hypothetical protein [Candidatus Rhabdochlamydia porcellionis]|jgi:hypothetical protein|uniref:PIN domain-containing protein n=1 Tax=Candidatus Rhabdochlamydia porcellionis TaxID=225148 RepID=A0ABX8YZG4_9BACT|nr:hypothetical protein [Candidatus Rhabdochlamydia porcellionis]QZA58370.1 hypothetical protein RHAB15C_0000243 [Candidatus Rhabdochlamydia porcellionis]
MTISSKLPDSLKKQESSKQTPKNSFSKLLDKKQKKLLKNEDKNLPENPIWAPNLILSPEKNPDLSTILSQKISETELSANTPVTSHFPIEIEELWEKLGSACILMNPLQDKEITFILDTNTLFSGMRITIKEYSTAPKIFNIELAPTSNAALSLISSHVPQLLNRFRQESFGFSVNDIIPELQSYATTAHQKQDDEGNQ